MINLDMNAPVEGQYDEGTYFMEVLDVDTKTARSGDVMLKLTLRGVHERGLDVKDTIMLGGRGWGIGRAKLTALGVPETFSGELHPSDLVDRRVYVFLKNEDWTPMDGKNAGKTFTNLRVDISQGTHSGYQPESNPPAGVAVPASGTDLDDTPF